jgi:NhaA family Na+:H+ antiporter
MASDPRTYLKWLLRASGRDISIEDGSAGMTKSQSWFARDATPSQLLLVATILSFAVMNSPWGDAFHHALNEPLGFAASAHMAINDGLMAVFFLFVGLELKREFIEGPLRDVRTAALPIAAALGGMIAPALIFLAIAARADPVFERGWAIPMATDIAFAIGALALLGSRVPAGLRLFLLTLAIVDDLGAIVVIAVFYTSAINALALGGAVAIWLAMLAMNRFARDTDARTKSQSACRRRTCAKAMGAAWYHAALRVDQCRRRTRRSRCIDF